MVTAARATLVSQVAGVNDGWPCLHPNNTVGTSANRGMNFNSGDLGIIYDRGDGKVNIVYGDNFGYPWKSPVATGPTGSGNANTSAWRPNSLLVSTPPATQLGVTGLIVSDYAGASDGQCKVLIPQLSGMASAIPTSAICIGGTNYMTVMDIQSWSGPQGWTTKRSVMCVSTNNGQDWARTGMVWGNTGGGSKFQQAALCQAGAYLYMYGTPNGRGNPAYLARCPLPSSPLVAASWQYWNGAAWGPYLDSAAVVIPAPVPELSARYDYGLGLFMLTYADDVQGMVLLTSPNATGPWQTQVLMPQGQGLSTYGGYQHPWSTSTDLYYVGSDWYTYQTFLFRSRLT